MIGLEVGPDQNVLIYAGNNVGEVFIYKLENLMSAFAVQDEEAKLPKAELKLLDMILTQDKCSIRSCKLVGDQTFAVATELDKVHIFRYDELQKQQSVIEAQS